MKFHITLEDDDGFVILKEETSLPEVAQEILNEAMEIYEGKKELINAQE